MSDNAKARIAAEIASRVKDGQCIGVGTGTTVRRALEAIREHRDLFGGGSVLKELLAHDIPSRENAYDHAGVYDRKMADAVLGH